MTKTNKLQPARRAIFYSALFIIMGGVAFLALLLPYSVFFQEAPLRDGDVADQDYRAPQALTYESEILTQIQRERVAAEVRPVYSAADPGVARRQL